MSLADVSSSSRSHVYACMIINNVHDEFVDDNAPRGEMKRRSVKRRAKSRNDVQRAQFRRYDIM